MVHIIGSFLMSLFTELLLLLGIIKYEKVRSKRREDPRQVQSNRRI